MKFSYSLEQTPFRHSFAHAAMKRELTESVFVKCETDCGTLVGYGEGCPRNYVTAETLESAVDFIKFIAEPAQSISDLQSLISLSQEQDPLISKNSAAWCAVETSLLDVLAQSKSQSIETLLGLPLLRSDFRFTAVLGIAEAHAFDALLGRYLSLGMLDFKLKVSGNLELDSRNLSAIETNATSGYQIRLDANNLWQNADTALAYLSALKPVFWAVEEPLAVFEALGLMRIAEELDVAIILDESFTSIAHLDRLWESSRFIPNIRVSKLGGVLRTTNITNSLLERGRQAIVGCQVGESSILTRLGLTAMSSMSDLLLSSEGAFGNYLLEDDPMEPCIMFANDGLLSTPVQIGAAGLGVHPKRKLPFTKII